MQIVATSDLQATAVDVLERALRRATTEQERVSFAVSGGSTPWPILSALADTDIDWASIDIYQVDERVAAAGDPVRNIVGLDDAMLRHIPARVHAMPVDTTDLESAAARYADDLGNQFDIVHFGLGDDGHTASLVPGDAALDVADRDVAVTAPYLGHKRMTLTYPAINRACRLVWLVAGARKKTIVNRLIAVDPSIPAAQVRRDRAVLVTNSI